MTASLGKSIAQTETSMFVFLAETHKQSQNMFKRLRALASSVGTSEASTASIQHEAREIKAWFNHIWREHHIDEETYVFPHLMGLKDEKLVAQAKQLVQEHVWLEETWVELEPLLSAAVKGESWLDPKEFFYAVELFEQLYADHSQLEDEVIYPAAIPLVESHRAKQVGHQMTQRRTLRVALKR